MREVYVVREAERRPLVYTKPRHGQWRDEEPGTEEQAISCLEGGWVGEGNYED